MAADDALNPNQFDVPERQQVMSSPTATATHRDDETVRPAMNGVQPPLRGSHDMDGEVLAGQPARGISVPMAGPSQLGGDGVSSATQDVRSASERARPSGLREAEAGAPALDSAFGSCSSRGGPGSTAESPRRGCFWSTAWFAAGNPQWSASCCSDTTYGSGELGGKVYLCSIWPRRT